MSFLGLYKQKTRQMTNKSLEAVVLFWAAKKGKTNSGLFCLCPGLSSFVLVLSFFGHAPI
jgi:hypothetical protein